MNLKSILVGLAGIIAALTPSKSTANVKHEELHDNAWSVSASTKGNDLSFDYYIEHTAGRQWASAYASIFNENMAKEFSMKFGSFSNQYFFGGEAGFFAPVKELEGAYFAKFQAGNKAPKGFRFMTGAGFIKMPSLNYGYLANAKAGEKSGNLFGKVLWNEKFAGLEVTADAMMSLYIPFNSQKKSRKAISASVSPIGDPSIYSLSHLNINAGFRKEGKHLSIGCSSHATLSSTIIHEHLADISVNFRNLMLRYSIGPAFYHNLYLDFLGTEKIKIFSYNNKVVLEQKINAMLNVHGVSLNIYGASGEFGNKSYKIAGSISRKFNSFNAEVYCSYNSFFETLNTGIIISFNMPTADATHSRDKLFQPPYSLKRAKAEGHAFYPHKDNPDVYINYMRQEYGETLDDAVKHIRNYEDIAGLVYLISYRNVDFGFEDADTVYRKGSSNCEGINGSLIPYLAREALGLDAEFAVILSPHVQHVIAVVFNEKGTIDIFDYSRFYRTGEKNITKAIAKVYPSFFFSAGPPSPLTRMIWNKMEETILPSGR